MKALTPTLRRLHSPDVYDLDSFRPTEADNFCVFIQAMFGSSDDIGEESFDILVCSPRWIEEKIRKDGPVIGRHHIIVNEFNIDVIRGVILRFASECKGSTWHDIALKLSRLGKWEFEDYRP
jgi:hypothetical protein